MNRLQEIRMSDLKFSRRSALRSMLYSLTFCGAICNLAHAAPGKPADAVTRAIAPTGVLRASINVGNAVLAKIDPSTGEPVGVSVDLARALAQRLNVPLQLVVVKTAASSVDNLSRQVGDVGFFSVDPRRAQEISFTRPYVLIEGFYAVPAASQIVSNEQVDQPGRTVVVSNGSAYDLFLTRTLKNAHIIRVQSSPAVVPAFLDQKLDVAAGVKQQLEHDAGQFGGLRLLEQRFMVIRQAMGIATSRGPDAAAFLASFVEDMKSSGFVAASLSRNGIDDVKLAGPSD
jgi:polar amino acid transport system substrate-binding protein